MRRTLSIVAVLVGLQATAHAHIQLTFPTQRYPDQKAGPCGRSAATDTGRGDVISVFEPGQTIRVTWQETINHPGHFRIAFDADGQDDFQDPATENTCDNAAPVLADCIADLPSGGTATYDITLPNIECENCTLQVIQLMTDKPPYGDGNDIYYQCADIALRAGGNGNPDAGVPGPDAGVPGPDAGVPGPDAGVPGPDAGVPGPDAGVPGPDAGTPPPPMADGCCNATDQPSSGGLLLTLLLVGWAVWRRRQDQPARVWSRTAGGRASRLWIYMSNHGQIMGKSWATR